MAKIPATVITGFLGAGKTTLLRHVIASASGQRLAFIVNEFGEVGIDRDLIKGCGDADCDDADVVELANGCICCTVADDFLPTMTALLDRPDPPQHIIIETSGLALPKPLVKAFAWPEIRNRVTVDGVIAVVDAEAVADGRFATDLEALAAQRAADPALDHDNPLEEVFADQISCADLVVLNKVDCVDPKKLAQARQELTPHLRPGVKVVTSQQAAVPLPILLGIDAAAEQDLATRPSRHELEGEDHDHDDFESFSVALPQLTNPQGFSQRLIDVVKTHDILRVKGFAQVEGKDNRLAFQGVGDRIHSYYDRPWQSAERRTGLLVIIGRQGLARSIITQAIEKAAAGHNG